MAKKAVSKSEAKRLQAQIALPPTSTTTGSNNGATVTIVEDAPKKITITAGQNGKFDVHFSSNGIFSRSDVRKALGALQRGYNKYLYEIRKGAKK